ncbi:hypothetical protein QBC38DRAFT_520872 [Podospora fimiseda]|uniref:Uncharacterized protein n=1 Tax=Podospora fimiseda TaxID=252190 RepID=A0AAN6YSQ3_9PEZI|nr:hypothetical protein QBC38DRAFT_520872 [Podospora fimiseda]
MEHNLQDLSRAELFELSLQISKELDRRAKVNAERAMQLELATGSSESTLANRSRSSSLSIDQIIIVGGLPGAGSAGGYGGSFDSNNIRVNAFVQGERNGPRPSAIPHLLSRYNFELVDEDGNVIATTPNTDSAGSGP